MRPLPLVALYLLVTTLPLVLSWLGGRPPRSALDELASAAGMLAFAIILVEFVLSGRFRTISSEIGMDVTMRSHQLLARSAVVLSLVHPFLYRAPSIPALPWDPTRQFTIVADFSAFSTGILAWLLLPALVAVAIWRSWQPYNYEVWRLIHGLGALCVAALLLHHALSAGRYSQDPVLAGLWSVLFLIAMLTLGHVYVFRPLSQLRRRWRVRSVRPAGLRTWELTIEPDDHRGLHYRAGQFVWLNVGNSPFSLRENPFSISSAPASGPAMQFVIKELGDFTATVGQIRPGTRAYVDGPHGNLVVSGRTEPGIALIAGGVGIAPLLGILRQLRLEDDPRPTVLVYGNRCEEQIVNRDEIDALVRAHGTRFVPVLSEPPPRWDGPIGQVDSKLTRMLFAAPEMRSWLYVICGPPPMMAAVEETLLDLGVSSGQILSERFRYD